MTKAEAMKIARRAKPHPRTWATPSDVQRACLAAGAKEPMILDGSDLWTLDALAHAIWRASRPDTSA